MTASGQRLNVTDRTIPLQLALTTTWGKAKLPPISYAIMPGTDGVVLLGLPTLRDLGLDPYTPVSYTHLRAHETDSYLVCRLLLEKKKK